MHETAKLRVQHSREDVEGKEKTKMFKEIGEAYVPFSDQSKNRIMVFLYSETLSSLYQRCRLG
jgi:hypothetical protein